MGACVCTGAYVHVYAHSSRSQRIALGAILQALSNFFFLQFKRQGFLIGLELTKQARLARQGDLGICLPASPLLILHMSTPYLAVLMWVLGIKLRLCLKVSLQFPPPLSFSQNRFSLCSLGCLGLGFELRSPLASARVKGMYHHI